MSGQGNSEANVDLLPMHSAREGREFARREVTKAEALPGILRAAREAQAAWSLTHVRDRARVLRSVVRYLHSHASDYSDRLSLLNGKPFTEAMIGEIYPTLATFRFFARKGPSALKSRRIPLGAMPLAYSRLTFDPLGVIGVISPWNYPFKLMLQDVPAALIAGNAVIIKVSEHASAVGDLVEELLNASDIPAGLVQLIHGRGELGEALIHSGVDKIVFTGSSRTGRLVYQEAARAMIPATLEMGGKDAAIVLEDADLDDAARGILWGALANCGQACASIESIYCPEGLHKELSHRCARLIQSLPLGSLGTMNTIFQRDKVLGQVEDALGKGASIVAQSPINPTDNPYAIPAVFLEGVSDETRLVKEEDLRPGSDDPPLHGY